LCDAQVILERSKAVAVINGTVGIRAAVAGVPVVTFHHAYQARLMPHVLFADSYDATRLALDRIARDQIPDTNTRFDSGRAFMAALEDCSFAVRDHGLLTGKALAAELDPNDVNTLTQALVDTLPTACEGTPMSDPSSNVRKLAT
jgi:hypothetical protein